MPLDSTISIIDDYETFLHAKDLSPATVSTYKYALGQLAVWYDGELETITKLEAPALHR